MHQHYRMEPIAHGVLTDATNDYLLTAEIPFFSPVWVKNVKPLQFFITPAKLLSPFSGQLAVDLL